MSERIPKRDGQVASNQQQIRLERHVAQHDFIIYDEPISVVHPQ
jgi:hypothetical protein